MGRPTSENPEIFDESPGLHEEIRALLATVDPASEPPERQEKTRACVEEVLNAPQVGDMLETLTGDYEIVEVRSGKRTGGVVVQAHLKAIGRRFIPLSALERRIEHRPQYRAFQDLLPQRTNQKNRWYLRNPAYLASFEKVQ